MPRPPKWRCVRGGPSAGGVFKPAGVPVRDLPQVAIRRDELEVVRLLDLEGLSQQEAAARVGVSRSTVSRTAARGRRALVRAVVEGAALVVEEGPVAVALSTSGSEQRFPHPVAVSPAGSFEDGAPGRGEERRMVIAVPHEGGMVNQHFGRTREFLVARSADGALEGVTVYQVPGMQHNHGALAEFLRQQDVDVILAGGMGPPMQAALKGAGFELFCGVSGRAEEAVRAYLRGEIEQNESTCGHHHEHPGGHAHHGHGSH